MTAMTAIERKRANHLANSAMLAHGLNPVKDQRRRLPYFARACEIVAASPPRTAFDVEHLGAFDDLRES